jgi:hypothetical protein
MKDLKQFIKTTIREFLNESKNYPTIYHFVNNIYDLEKILDENKLKSNRGYISFTRNYDLKFQGSNIRLNLNGEKLSRIEGGIKPTDMYGFKRKKHFEYEETIKTDVINGIKNYLISINIIDYDEHLENPYINQNGYPISKSTFDKKLKQIIEKHNDININLVHSFKPIK